MKVSALFVILCAVVVCFGCAKKENSSIMRTPPAQTFFSVPQEIEEVYADLFEAEDLKINAPEPDGDIDDDNDDN
jgi:hypothetical protein